MVTVLQFFFALALIVVIILFVFSIRKENKSILLPENYRELLNDYVKFYHQLDEEGKEKFEERVEQLLSAVQITGVNAVVEDIDRLLIAAGAIIPVYAIPDWQYVNLHEVLLYPGTFNEDFDQPGI
jgi:Mlc titration factor MtfA (ptsG expression regulator)